jgi:hypothetical protein
VATTDEAMVWTCRLALAAAEQDEAEIRAVVDEATAVPGGPGLLLTTMAGTIAALMADKSGNNWRQAIRETLAAVRGS